MDYCAYCDKKLLQRRLVGDYAHKLDKAEVIKNSTEKNIKSNIDNNVNRTIEYDEFDAL